MNDELEPIEVVIKVDKGKPIKVHYASQGWECGHVGPPAKPMIDGAALLRLLAQAWDDSPYTAQFICRQLGIDPRKR